MSPVDCERHRPAGEGDFATSSPESLLGLRRTCPSATEHRLTRRIAGSGCAGCRPPPADRRCPVSSAAGRLSDGYRRYALSLLVVVSSSISSTADPEHPRRGDPGRSRPVGHGARLPGRHRVRRLLHHRGHPIARWADRGSRRSIIARPVGVERDDRGERTRAQLHQLALARVGVGLGEAACTPPAHSLLSDYYPPERRGTAF